MKKCISIVVALCLLSLGSSAFAQLECLPGGAPGHFGGSWAFQNDWHNTATDFCNGGATITDSNDWFDPECWGIQPQGTARQCGVAPPDWTVFAAMEPKGDCALLNTSPYWPGQDANGFDAYATQIFLTPWSWEYAPSDTFTVGPGVVVNSGRLFGIGFDGFYAETWGTPVVDVNGGTIYTPGFRNFDANCPYDDTKFDNPDDPLIEGEGLGVGGGNAGIGANYAFLNIRDGGKVIVPRVRIFNGEVNIFPDGLLYDTNESTGNFFISQTRARNKVNIAGGELRLQGDRRDQIAYYVSKGRIVACNKHGDLTVEYNDVDAENIFTSATSVCTPDAAWDPAPLDGATGVVLSTILSWKAGPSIEGANPHGVYFGTDETAVESATPTEDPQGVFKGRQAGLTYPVSGLVMDTNYFWRVDEFNDAHSLEWKGNIWQFKSKGPQASAPYPADLSTGMPFPISLKWESGAKATGATAHAVFFGPNQTNVSDATIGNQLGCFMGYVTDPVFTLSSMDANLVANIPYYWKINESNGIDEWPGEVWTVNHANYFVVEDFDSYEDNAEMLAKWAQGSSYTTCGSQHPRGIIEWDFNDGDGAMQFSYNNAPPTSPRYSEARMDVNDGNAQGQNWTGGNALPDNDKIRSLAIGFNGNAINDHATADRMYVAIQDTAGNIGVKTNPDVEAQRSFGWGQWYVNLSDANFASVNKTNIRYLYVGFGTRCNTSAGTGGSGVVRYDDIRLYQQACLPQYAAATDLSDDCLVNVADLDVMANAWLDAPVTIPNPVDPGTTGLTLWHRFDSTTGTTLVDSSGNGYAGDVNCDPNLDDPSIGIPSTILWEASTSPDGGNCINITPWLDNEVNVIVDLDTRALNNSQTSITLAVWINGDTYMPLSGWPRLIAATQDFNTLAQDENEAIEIECPVPRTENRSWTTFRAGIIGDSNGVSTSQDQPLSAYAGSWQHWAFVRDGIGNRIYIYHNGGQVADGNAVNPLFDNTIPFEHFRLFATRWDYEKWYGKMDDFRVYNRALTPGEIGWLGTVGHNGVVPWYQPSNLKTTSPDRVNLNDFAILANDWLETSLWPNP